MINLQASLFVLLFLHDKLVVWQLTFFFYCNINMPFHHEVTQRLDGPLVQPQITSEDISKSSLIDFQRPSILVIGPTEWVNLWNSFSKSTLVASSFNFQTFLFSTKSFTTSFTAKTIWYHTHVAGAVVQSLLQE